MQRKECDERVDEREVRGHRGTGRQMNIVNFVTGAEISSDNLAGIRRKYRQREEGFVEVQWKRGKGRLDNWKGTR